MGKELLKQEEVKKMVIEDLLTVDKSKGDFKSLKKAIVRLHKIWVLEETKQNIGSLDVMQEYGIKRKLAENKVKVLNEQLKNDQRNFEKENKRILKENVQLIQEINHIKQVYHLMKTQALEKGLSNKIEGTRPLPRS